MDESLRPKARMLVAFACLFSLITLPAFLLNSVLGEACIVSAGLCIVGAVIVRIRMFGPRLDPYDIRTLKKIHEKEELRRLEEEGVGVMEFDSFVCMGCGEVYNLRMPICPRCKLPQGQPPCC